jgi:hypothetical protein
MEPFNQNNCTKTLFHYRKTKKKDRNKHWQFSSLICFATTASVSHLSTAASTAAISSTTEP